MSNTFTCPKCEDKRIEEVTSGVTVASELIIDDDGYISYGEQSNQGGEVERYQCMGCGYVIPANDEDELVEYVTSQHQSRESDILSVLYEALRQSKDDRINDVTIDTFDNGWKQIAVTLDLEEDECGGMMRTYIIDERGINCTNP